ncbi:MULTISPECIES: NB-ARC domain-containing protein [Saccharothrix]|uniref:NB-ARC domain-containing protein n=1 Tax=Saccharothrix TaxID=2071 RepID=UPI0009391017|nr:NB-ARC domain-containing protein [Saccharothrix sp. CB00851]OKI29945.1 hypothetical protein A6A25_30020 [Saccharothrix sp. CB00851]
MSAHDPARDETTGAPAATEVSVHVHGAITGVDQGMAIGAVAGNVHYHQARRRVVWPVRVGVPHAPAEHYQQRRAHAVLLDTLAAGHSVVLVGAGQRAGVVMSGMGGVGKTQMAARHAWSVWGDPVVDVAVWVSALSRDAIVTAYAEAASRVLVEQDPRIADRPPEQAAERFREWLAGTPRRWLIVLDDVQDPADLPTWTRHPVQVGRWW